MCGLVGVLSTEINTFNHPYGKFFKQALFADTLRGEDSTGVFVMDTKKMNQPELFKKAFPAPDFLQLKQAQKLLRDSADWNIMIGHNRAATKGGVSHHTAHPFQIGNITLVHNGTVSNHRLLPNGHKFDVDSEAICDAINTLGIDEVVKKIDGAFTFIYHDVANGSLNFIRNEERPLAFGKVKDRDTILMASEAHMLRWLAVRNNLSLESIAEPKPGELFTFWPHKDNKDWTKDFKIRTLELRPKNVYNGYQGGYRNNYGNQGNVGGHGKKHQSTTVTHGKTSKTTSGTVTHTDTDKLLSSLALEKGEEVCLINTEWVPYPGSKTKHIGMIVGQIEDVMSEHIGVIHGIERVYWEDQLEGAYIYSKVNNATVDVAKKINVFLHNREFSIIDPSELPLESDNDEDGKEVNKALAVVMFRGFNGEDVTLREFERQVEDGCCYCGGNIDPTDHEKTGWTHNRQPVCKDCVKIHDLGEYLH